MAQQKETTAGYAITNGRSVHNLRDQDATHYSTTMYDLTGYMTAAGVLEMNLARMEGRMPRSVGAQWTNVRAIREIERLTGVHPQVKDVFGCKVLTIEHGDTFPVRFYAHVDEGGAW